MIDKEIQYKYIKYVIKEIIMRRTLYLTIFALLLTLPACMLRFPMDWGNEYGYGDYSIVFQVQPEDAHVLLNGRFIGEAYEFSTRASALKVRSARNEIVIKKEGYLEELIDLNRYGTRRITVTLTLKPDRVPVPKTVETVKTTPPPPPPPNKKGRELNVVKEKEIPKTEEKLPVVSSFSHIVMTVSPSESSIYVDGKFWGISPENGIINNFNLPKGKHKIEVVKPGYETVIRDINADGKNELKIDIKLDKK